jgi:hypothetical protein
VLRLLVSANVVSSSPILVTLMMETLHSSETLFLTSSYNVSPVRYELGFYIPVDGILYSHRRENLKPYSELSKLSFTASYWSKCVRKTVYTNKKRSTWCATECWNTLYVFICLILRFYGCNITLCASEYTCSNQRFNIASLLWMLELWSSHWTVFVVAVSSWWMRYSFLPSPVLR